MKNNLYLDMVLDSCNFLLFDDKNKIIDQFFIKTNNNLIDKVIDYLNTFLNKNNLKYNNLNNLYVNIGPGSFTGTKAIVNIVKTIKLVFKDINIFTITNDLVFNKGNGISIIDAKSNKYYISVYENYNEQVKLSIYNSNEK
ncbi:MAG: tRNA (adenosine(37)-N6)-threonylcarbamoyltransferase complex dimerization subunit type 1 TsaB, partial [Ureaplasma sp.]|nr:tRNA (adenosine(37)-N6)-threonylcarbamoyltransferase complex dimerization subunit type 1 TsaB [Ureaplasma sp.]